MLIPGKSDYQSMLLARNDCVYQSRFFADWALFWDFNEFFCMIPPTEFHSLIAENLDLLYIAFGNQKWNSSYYAPEIESSPWATNRMVFLLALPKYHKDRNASREHVGGEGNRHFVVNLRKVFAVHHHFILDPSWGGADVSTKKVWLNQWIGSFLSTTDPVCTMVKNPDEIDPLVLVDGYWYHNANFAAALRDTHNAPCTIRCPLPPTSNFGAAEF